MRSLRAMLAGLMVLALIVGLGAASAAQCEERPVLSADFAYSTGTFRQAGMEEGEYIETGDIEGSRERGGSVTIQIESDDPRISGDLVIDPFNADEEPGIATNGIFWGTGQLVTDEGSWQGPVEGISHEQGMTSVGWLTGAGGYEGLTWFYRATAPFGDEEKYDRPFAESLVYWGDPPPEGASFTIATGDVVTVAEFEGPIEYAPLPSIDPSLVPDADGFVFEDVAPGVRRLVTDGAGHFPSATYVCEARDMDEFAVDEEGRVLVWSTTHGIDNDLAGDSQLWVLGVEGVLSQSEAPVQPTDPDAGQLAPDGSTWSIAWYNDDGAIIRSEDETAQRFLGGYDLGSLAITPDGRVWVTEGHDSGEAGGIYVIEPDAVGEPVDAASVASTVDATEEPPEVVMGGPAPVWERVLDLEDRGFTTLLATDSGLWAIEGDRYQPSALWHSTDGGAWTQLDTAALLGEGAVVSEIAEGGPGLLAVGSVPSGAAGEAVAWTSADGQEWTVSPLGHVMPEPERPFEVSELRIRAVAAGPGGAVIAATPVGFDFGLLEPDVVAALPTGLRDYVSGTGLMIDPGEISVSVGPFEVFSEAVPNLDVDQDLFDAYGRATSGGTEDLLLFVTDDYVTWQQVDEWAGGDNPVSAMTATRDGYLAATWAWGSGPGPYASADGLAWEETELPADSGTVRWFGAEGGRLLMAGDLGRRSAVWGSDDGGETWTAWAGLPDDAWDVRAGAFGLVATGQHESEWWDRSQWAPTIIERDGLTLSIDQGPGGLTVAGPDGETLLTADLSGAGDGPEALALPSSIAADHDRAVFTVVDPESGGSLMTVTYREMQDAFELAQGPAGLGPDMFAAYSADGRVWSEQPVSELAGVPGWIGPVAVGDDFAVMVVSELDGPSSLWRATPR